MSKHLKELIELAKNDQAIDSYNPQLEAADNKKNNLQSVEKVFRCNGNISWCDWLGRFNYREEYRGGVHFQDILTVCRLIDGQGYGNYGTDFRVLAYQAFYDEKLDTVETPYFLVKCFKNGSQLVKWKRDDVLALFNQIGSGNNGLPDVMKKRYKAGHF